MCPAHSTEEDIQPSGHPAVYSALKKKRKHPISPQLHLCQRRRPADSQTLAGLACHALLRQTGSHTYLPGVKKSSKRDKRQLFRGSWNSHGPGQANGGAAGCPRSPSTSVPEADWPTAQGGRRSGGRRSYMTGRPTAALPKHTHTRPSAGAHCNTQTPLLAMLSRSSSRGPAHSPSNSPHGASHS